MMIGRDFIMNDRNFHDDRSRIYLEWSRFSWSQVEMIMNGWDFYDDSLRFSLSQVKIFMMTG